MRGSACNNGSDTSKLQSQAIISSQAFGPRRLARSASRSRSLFVASPLLHLHGLEPVDSTHCRLSLSSYNTRWRCQPPTDDARPRSWASTEQALYFDASGAWTRHLAGNAPKSTEEAMSRMEPSTTTTSGSSTLFFFAGGAASSACNVARQRTGRPEPL